MGIGTGGAAAIGAGVSAATGLGGAALQANAAGKAAQTQANAADFAAQLQFQEAQQALGFQEQQYANTLGLEEPGYLTGNESLGTLAQLMGLDPQAANTSIFSNPFGASGAPTGVNPGLGSSLPPGVLGNPGGGPVPMQADAASNTVPLSALASPQQNAAAIEGFGNPIDTIRAPIDFGNGNFNPTQAGGSTSPNPKFSGLNQPGGMQGGPVTSGQGPITVSGNPGAGASGGLATQGPGPGQPPISPAGSAPGTIGNTGLPQGFLAQTWNTPFVAPTADQAAQMPGYQFQLQQGQQALQNSAAARGGLLSGGTAKALDQYSQGLASTDYQNLYNQALTQYQQAYNIFNQNQSNVFNRYAALAGIGQTSAQQLSNAGLTTGNNVANTLLTSGAQIGGDIQNAAAANASGYIGAANAYGGAISNLGGLAQLLPLYRSLQSNPTASTPGADIGDPNAIGSPGSTIFE
jgi:hypothetical protein